MTEKTTSKPDSAYTTPCPQRQMLAKLKSLCRENDTIVAAMLYGSFALGEADAYSDLDVVLFVTDSAFNTLDEQRAWVAQLAPVGLYFVNEFGVPNAIFENLVRGEFHFDKTSMMAQVVQGWSDGLWFPSVEPAILIDKTGELTHLLRGFVKPPIHHGQTLQERQDVANRWVNWCVFGISVLQRGEYARALELLSMGHRQLLMLARILENTTVHWYIPSRAAEHELAPETLAHFAGSVAAYDEDSLWEAYHNAWTWFLEMLPGLRNVTLSEKLVQKITRCFTQERET